MIATYNVETNVTTLSSPEACAVKAFKTSFYVKVRDLPTGLPAFGNPRSPNIDRRLYSQIEKSFLNESNQVFHLQNRGITIFAERVSISGDQKKVEVTISDNPQNLGGVIDGRHTELLLLGDGITPGIRDQMPDRSIVITIFHDLPISWRSDTATALNTSSSLPIGSAHNSKGYFEGIKGVIRGTILENRVQFHQNGVGKKDSSIGHLINLMYVMRLDLFPGSPDDEKGKIHPSYSLTASKQKFHEEFPKELGHYAKLYPILVDLCHLYDIIETQTCYLVKAAKKGESLNLKGSETASTWMGRPAMSALHVSLVLPMLSAFRFLMEIGPDGNYRWKIPFYQVCNIYYQVALSWHKKVQDDSKTKDLFERNSSNRVAISVFEAFGANRYNWSFFYNKIRDKFNGGQFDVDLDNLSIAKDKLSRMRQNERKAEERRAQKDREIANLLTSFDLANS
jgi:hypothetical protein